MVGLGAYIEIVVVPDVPASPKYQVRYEVKQQSFDIGGLWPNLQEAVWFRDMFLIALNRMVSEATTS